MNILKKIAKKISDRRAPLAGNDNGSRVVVLHNHIFKNAGSTIDWALEKNFGSAFVDHREDNLMRQGASYLELYLLKNSHIKALSSHHLTMPLPELSNVRMLTIMMFRHPIERVTSVYNFERAQESDTHPGVIHARKFPLREYIHWRMKPEVGATIRNFQARKMLPPRKIGQEIISDAEMNKITRQLSEMEMIGLVERFDESMVLFEECLRQIYPQIDLSYVAQNVGQKASEKKETRLERLESEIGGETYDLLLKNNQQDLLLFEIAQEEVDSRISRTQDFAGKLAEFRSRCSAKLAAIA